MYDTNVPSSTRPRPRRRSTRLLTAGLTVVAVTALAATTASADPGGRDADHDRSASTTSGPHTVAAQFRFRTIDDPADPTFNQLLGINDHGRIVGYFGSGATPDHPNKGYVVKLSPDHPVFVDENVPGSAQTQVVGINDAGTTVGFSVDGNGANIGFVARNGRVTPVAHPATAAGAPFNQLLGINRRGVAVGFFNDAAGHAHGYTYDTRSRRFGTVVLPVAADSVTATGINDDGDVSGFFVRGATTAGFVLHHGRLRQLSFGAGTNTQALGINAAGRVVGSYLDAAGAMHGFVWSPDQGLTPVDAPRGTGGTLVNGLNDRGQLVGFFVDAAGNTNGFVAQR